MNKSFENTKLDSAFGTQELSVNISIGLLKLVDISESLARRYSEYKKSKKAIRELQKLDARMLEDIGISEADVIRVSLADNPSCELVHLNQNKPETHRAKDELSLPTSSETKVACC